MPPNDPRFLALTTQDMELDFWTAYYATLAAQGKSFSFDDEDDDYNLDDIENALAEKEAMNDSEQWDAWQQL